MDAQYADDAFQTLGICLLTIDAGGTIDKCTPEAAQLFGYTRDEMRGLPLARLLPDIALERARSVISRVIDDASASGVLGRRKDGIELNLQYFIKRVKNPVGPSHFTLVVHDIGDAAEPLKKLHHDLMLSDLAIRGAGIGVVEFFPDSMVVSTSSIAQDILELKATDPAEMRQEWRSRVHPDDLEIALSPTKILMTSNLDQASCEYRFLTPDGRSWRWIRAGLFVTERKPGGTPRIVASTLIDVTERKRHELALVRSNEQFRLAFDNAPIGKAIVNLDGTIHSVNTAFCSLYGYSETMLVDKEFNSFLLHEDVDSDVDQLVLLKAGEIPSYRIEKRLIRGDGAIVWGLMSVALIKAMNGDPEAFIVQIVDVTEHRRLIELKNEFVATVSHELRTPLTSIVGALSLLTSFTDENYSDQTQRLLYIAQQNGNRLRALIDDILDFEKYSSGQVTFTLTETPILPLIEDAVMANTPIAEKYDVTCNVISLSRRLNGYTDQKRFHQIMANLLSNATKFANKGSVVDIMVERTGDFVRVAVKNQGVGISDAFRKRIFKPFSQAEQSATRSRGGTGLGLSIVKQIVEQSGGEVGYDSVPNGFTTFWFTIPTKRPAPRTSTVRDETIYESGS
ncbi:PAS domain-containing sensor histidine kinase [Pararhodobacter zhoushanensis]|uniref:PAS domain-containing sensor histidine kinase n=1 Tax=Pararhodobacter zhoushanensis TaxID=2479545 RepID=UPI0013DEE827|nr:PAS domain-containing sensor histidine kinase [Pararhodobacter zhoushanensis]